MNERFGNMEYEYGGNDALEDLKSRVYEYQNRIKYSESYTPSEMKQFKYDLATTYNPEIYKLTKVWSDGAPMSNEEVEYAQKYLKYIGLYDGDIDGLYGEKTKQAYKEYSTEHIDRHTFQAMKNFGAEKWNQLKTLITGDKEDE